VNAPTADALKGAAHEYARRGWRVVPLYHVIDTATGPMCTCKDGRACGSSSGKHPNIKKWQNNASRSGADIETWWGERPRSGVGIATGADSSLFVLDVDPDNGGFETLAALEREHGPLPPTRTIRTGSGGFHKYFPWPGFAVSNSAGKLGPGLDIRGNGGQAVAPPSRSGKGDYTLEVDLPLADAPAWLLDLLRPTERPAATPGGVPVSTEVAHHYAAKALESELATLRATTSGRNDQLNRSAFALGQLVARGALDAQHVRDELAAASVANGYVAKDGIHAMHATLESGLGRGTENPRTPWPPIGDRLSDDTIEAICEVYSSGSPGDIALGEWLLDDMDMNMPGIPAQAGVEAATDDELDAWLTRFTRYTSPARLYRRMEWMTKGKLTTHARALVDDTLNGDYPASLALRELTAVCQKRGHLDPAAPRTLLAVALGAALDAKAVTR
jgi:hypothetical protein